MKRRQEASRPAIVAKVRRILVGEVAAVVGVALFATVVVLVRYADVREGDESRIAGLMVVLGLCAAACGLLMVMARITVNQDGLLTKDIVRKQAVDLTRLAEVRTTSDTARLGDRPVGLRLTDRDGGSAVVPATFRGWIYDEEHAILRRVAEAAEENDIALSGLVRNLLSDAAGRPLEMDVRTVAFMRRISTCHRPVESPA